jgi:hypothetical protein
MNKVMRCYRVLLHMLRNMEVIEICRLASSLRRVGRKGEKCSLERGFEGTYRCFGRNCSPFLKGRGLERLRGARSAQLRAEHGQAVKVGTY